jgi:hypothetical protein
MPSVVAMYVPFLERAVGPAILQLLLMAMLGSALYAYLSPRCGHKATMGTLIIGEILSFLPPVFRMLAGLGDYGDECRRIGAEHSDPLLILIAHFELYGFALWSSFFLLVSALILNSATTAKPPHEHGGCPKSPPGKDQAKGDEGLRSGIPDSQTRDHNTCSQTSHGQNRGEDR